MVTIGCAGFPVPATRYFKEFLFVEVQETHVGVPGMGTLRRWRREAPGEFVFSLLASRDIGAHGFRGGDVVDGAIQSLQSIAKEVGAGTAVFVAPPEFVSNRANKALITEFLRSVHKKFDRVVWEASPGWDPDDVASIAEEARVLAARDPLAHGAAKGPVAYYRLP